MNKICTTIEQSKKLIKLGIGLTTADMIWHKNLDGTHSLRVDDIILRLDTPAWSLTALLDMLDYEVVDGEGESYYLKIDKDDIEYQIRYEDRWNSGIETRWYDNLLDAAFEMVCLLKENNKI